MTIPKLVGCGTALVTPFTSSGDIDEKALRAFVEWQITEGIHFVVPCGSTGEAVTMTVAEHRRVVEITVEQVNGRVPVVGGAGSNDTVKAIALSKEVKAAGATHLLQVAPMYNKPPQRGMLAHFRAIADAVDLPIVLYNVPGRTASNIEAKTTLELAEDTRFVAMKEASANLTQIGDIIRNRPEHFTVLSGDDSWTLPIMAMGGDGIVSVVSNATPRAMAKLSEACAAGDYNLARKIEASLAPWMHAAFIESNPMPAKAALKMLGKVEENFRLPLVPMLESNHPLVRAALVHAGALSA